MNQPKIKSFFEKPEGTTGLVFIAAAIVATFTLGWYFLPFIITVLQNLIYASVLGGVLFAGTALLMNDSFRFLMSSMFKSTMRWLTGFWIAVDPIGILKNYLQDMKDRLTKIEEHLRQLYGQTTGLRRKIEERTHNIDEYMKFAKAAQDRGQVDMLQLQTSKAAREKHFVEKLSVTLSKMEDIQKILVKMKKNLEFLYEDTSHEVEIQEEEYKAIKSAFKAMKGAQALIEGDKAKEIFEQTLEYIAQDIGMKLGEMDRFMEASQGFMDGMDLQNAVFNEEGLKMLEQWESTGSTLLAYDKNRKVRIDTSTGDIREEDEPNPTTEAPRASSFSSIFSK